jgi:ABC-type tungstate transport system permease subunit
MEATTGAKIAVAIGGTGYAIDLGDRGRIPASIVQRYHAATGGR